MRKFRSKVRSAALATACALSLAVAAPALAVNVIVNNGFEAGLSGWLTSGNVSTSSITVHAGTLSASLASDSSAIGYTLATPVPVSSVVEFSLWAQSSVGPLSLIVFSYNDGSTSGDDASIFDLGNSDWTSYDLTGLLAAGKTLTGFSIFGNSGAATFIDEVVLNIASVSEPGTVALWTAGLGGIAWLGRRRRPARAKVNSAR